MLSWGSRGGPQYLKEIGLQAVYTTIPSICFWTTIVPGVKLWSGHLPTCSHPFIEISSPQFSLIYHLLSFFKYSVTSTV